MSDPGELKPGMAKPVLGAPVGSAVGKVSRRACAMAVPVMS